MNRKVSSCSFIQQFSGATVIRGYVVKIFGEVFHREATQDHGQNISVLCECDCISGNPLSQSAYFSAIIIGMESSDLWPLCASPTSWSTSEEGPCTLPQPWAQFSAWPPLPLFSSCLIIWGAGSWGYPSPPSHCSPCWLPAVWCSLSTLGSSPCLSWCHLNFIHQISGLFVRWDSDN